MVPTGRQAHGVPGEVEALLYVCSLLRRTEPMDPDGLKRASAKASAVKASVRMAFPVLPDEPKN